MHNGWRLENRSTVAKKEEALNNITRKAAFSRCQRYRYTLERRWEIKKPAKRVVFIGLNPSTADHRVDDPTIRRCMGFARSWGFNELTVVNLFAYRTPYPTELKQASDPIGVYNSRYLGRVIREADLIIACWGRHGTWRNQDTRLANRFRDRLFCLAENNDGSPVHPLYQKSTAQPRPWPIGRSVGS